MADAVQHPPHYGGDAIYETIKVLEAWLSPEQFIGFCRGNTIKYQSRAGKKGDVAEDLRKSEFYSAYERDFRRRLDIAEIGEERAASIAAVVSTMLLDHQVRELLDALDVPAEARPAHRGEAFKMAIDLVKRRETRSST